MKHLFPLITLLTLIPLQALAAEKPDSKNWEISAEVGFVSTSGNTETETLNAKGKATTEREQWRHDLEMSALNSSDGNRTTAEKYIVSAQSDYRLAKPAYLFATVNYEKDRFSGFDYQLSEAVGYGRRVIEHSDLSLDLEIGPGARQTKLVSGQSENEALLRGAAKLKWKISDTSKFTEDLSIDAGEDNTITKSEASLSSKINGSLSMKLSFTLKHTSDVPPGVDKTDSETAVTLVYSF